MSVRACVVSAFVVAFLFCCGGVFDVAHATSRIRASVGPSTRVAAKRVCRVSARFVEAKPKRGKIVWIFERLPDSATTCDLDDSRFEVWIWQGQYSTLTGTNVYPLYIDEPSPGAEFDVELDRRTVRELPSGNRYSGWFLAEGEKPLKARDR